MMMNQNTVNIPRRPPVPNTTSKPLPLRSSSNPQFNRNNFTPTDEEINLRRQILVSRGLDAEAGSLKGEQAREVFNRSALPFPTLRDIWNVADEDGSGDLTRDEIVMALRLIGWVQAGEKLSPGLLTRVGPLPTLDGITDVQYAKPRRSGSIGGQVNTSSSSPSDVGSESVPSISLFPAVNQEHVNEFRAMFTRAGPANGLLSQDKVMNVYMTSNLSYEELRKILNAVARRTIQMLDFPEFACGLYILRALQSSQLHSVPSAIPVDIYEQFTVAEPLCSSSRTLPTTHTPPPQAHSPPIMPTTTEPSPIHLMAAVTSQLSHGRQSVPPNFLGQRPSPSNLPQRQAQTPGPSLSFDSSPSNRNSIVTPSLHRQVDASPEPDWDVPVRDRNTYELYFYKIDEPGNGWIERETFDEFVKVYRLRREDLDKIWHVTHLTGSGRMNLDEFIVAIYLVKKCSEGCETPTVLPLALIPPSLRRDVSSISSSSVSGGSTPRPLPPPRARIDSEVADSPSSSPKIGKKPPPVPPKRHGSISYKKPPSPTVSSSGPSARQPMSPVADTSLAFSPSSTSSISPNLAPKPHHSPSTPSLRHSVSSSPSVPPISEVEVDTQSQSVPIVSSPFEDNNPMERSFAEHVDRAQGAGMSPRGQSSGSGSGSSETTSRYFDHHRQSYAPPIPPLPSNYENGSPPPSQPFPPIYQPSSPPLTNSSPNHEALEGFKEEISRLGRQVETLLGQLASQNTIRDTNDALRMENEILKTQVKDTERMMNDVLATSLQQEASRARAAASADAELHNQSAEEIWRLMAEVSSKETRIEDLERRVEGLSREERELRDSLREAEAQNTKSKADFAELERKLEGKDGEIEQTKKRLAELERAMMDEVVNASGSGNGAASGSGSGGGGRSKPVKANANKDDPSVKELKVLIRDVTKENEGLKGDLRDMQRSMEQMLMSGSRGMVEEIERENRRLKAQVGDLEGMVGQMQASVGESSNSRKNQEAMEQMKSQLKDIQRAFTEYRTTSEARTGEVQQRIDELMAENNRLKIEVHEAGERERRRGAASGQQGHGEDDNVPPPAYVPYDPFDDPASS